MQIISVLLLTVEDDDALAAAAERMSLHRLRDSMGNGLEPVLGYLRSVRVRVSYPTRVLDSLYARFSQAGVSDPAT